MSHGFRSLSGLLRSDDPVRQAGVVLDEKLGGSPAAGRSRRWPRVRDEAVVTFTPFGVRATVTGTWLIACGGINRIGSAIQSSVSWCSLAPSR